MGTLHHLHPANVLDPAEIQLAASALDAASARLGPDARERSAQVVARFILQRMFRGERDVIRLRDGALAELEAAILPSDATTPHHGARCKTDERRS